MRDVLHCKSSPRPAPQRTTLYHSAPHRTAPHLIVTAVLTVDEFREFSESNPNACSARWTVASSVVTVAATRPTPSAPGWARRRFRTSGTAATARQRALMNRNHSSRPRRRRQARALHERGVELPAAGPSAMQVPEGLLRQAWACLNRILIIKTELRSIIPGVPILGAL